MPAYVERELRGLLTCGVLAHGFCRFHGFTCGAGALVAFSGKGRGFCPSCGGRRMAESAAHLIDHVVPDVTVRQWVISFPLSGQPRPGSSCAESRKSMRGHDLAVGAVSGHHGVA